ncbi:microtubule nucleation factor SSNA1-like [Saccostrea echinata]|uniref:microtubule nucleation factor SSNA1-like n=1 Tax=Saccostrea echinata TaxID=191078 RepID=UPI002A82865E|nr:microtubule nucleation factor SSNA1-like [Saccostrea echinata]
MTSQQRKKRDKNVKPIKEDAFLQKYNMELLKCIDDMKMKRDEVNRSILTLSDEQQKLESDVLHLTAQLARVNESLCKKMKQQGECDELISEYNEAFHRLLYGQQTLLANVRRSVNTVAPSVILEESEAASLSSRQAARSSKMSFSTRGDTRADGRKDSRRDSRTDVSHQESRAESTIQ